VACGAQDRTQERRQTLVDQKSHAVRRSGSSRSATAAAA
jgi:hypothetical protein